MSQCLKETKVRIYLYKDNYEKIRNSEYSTTSSLILQITFYYRHILNKFLDVSTLVFHFPALPSDPFKSFSFFPPVKNPFPLLEKKKTFLGIEHYCQPLPRRENMIWLTMSQKR